MVEGLRHPGKIEHRPHFRGKAQHVSIKMIEQRSDAEAVSCKEDRPPAAIPDHDCKIAIDMPQETFAERFVGGEQQSRIFA